MRLRPILAVALCALTLACNKKSPTEPTSPAPSTPTRIIGVTGNLSFGDVEVPGSAERTFAIVNSGTDILTVTSLSGPSASNFVASWISGSIPPGGSQNVTVRFTPTEVRSYSGTLTINGNQTGGVNTLPIVAAGVRTSAVWTRSGRGNTVFDIPGYVTRVRIQGTWDRRDTSNFIVRIAGRLVVNEILRDSITYDGTHLITGGGTAEVVSSTNIDWVFTEVR